MMNIYNNEIFYLVKVENIKNIKKNLVNDLMIKSFIPINNIIIIIIIYVLVVYTKIFVKNNEIKKAWFCTGRKSISLYERYSEKFDKDIILITNKIFDYNSFILVSNFLDRSKIIKTYKNLSKEVNSILNDNELGSFNLLLKYRYKSLYLSLLMNVLENKRIKILYITEKESSWGQAINKVSIDIDCKLFVIPHGVEYNFILPNGYPGNKFYTTTFKASKDLNEIYDTDKFEYDESISKYVLKMFITPQVKIKNIVFFPEGRNVIIDQSLLEELINRGLKPLLCIHPLDNEANYSKFKLNVIPYNKAINNNVIISRNSSVLLEALSYNSLPVSVICNDRDKIIKDSIPSLNINEIFTVKSVKDLIYLLEKVDFDKQYNRIQLNEAIY